VLIIGAGVSGLTTAFCLRRKGFDVTVVAERFAPRVTSVVAGALWEWPPAVCGHHNDLASLARSKLWCERSYEIFTELAGDPETGVFMRPVNFYFKAPIEESPRHLAKMEELKHKVRLFRHDPGLIRENGVNAALGLRDAYTHVAPMVDTDAYMEWLQSEVKRAGARIFEHKVSSPLREHEAQLRRQFGADAIINCAGMGAGELASETLQPLRGALIRVRNDGSTMPRVTEAHCISHDGSTDEPGFVFIVPRGRDMLVLGGLAEPDQSELDIGLHNYEPIRAMYRRCIEFMPALRDAEIDAAEPVRVGLRPVRPRNVRLELEPGMRILHNYGHGGSGVTFSWGCSLEIAHRVEGMIFGDG
jgi:D-amino-acid oxidase